MNSEKKQLWVLAGGNGAGKTTFYNHYLKKHGIKFVNADLIARVLNAEHPERMSYEAATLATEIREDMVARGESFCFETVFSHPSKIDFIARAKACGYAIILVYIHIEKVALNEARVYLKKFMRVSQKPCKTSRPRCRLSIRRGYLIIPLKKIDISRLP